MCLEIVCTEVTFSYQGVLERKRDLLQSRMSVVS